MRPSNLKIGQCGGEEGDVEIKLFPGEEKVAWSDPESFSSPELEPSGKIEEFFLAFEEAIEVSSDVRCALDGSCSEACGSE